MVRDALPFLLRNFDAVLKLSKTLQGTLVQASLTLQRQQKEAASKKANSSPKKRFAGISCIAYADCFRTRSARSKKKVEHEDEDDDETKDGEEEVDLEKPVPKKQKV